MAINYITKPGFENLRSELSNLLDNERPKVVEVVSWAAGNGDRSENGDYLYGKRRLREIDSRIRFLRKRLEAAQVIDIGEIKSEKVVFGAKVEIQYSSDERTEEFQIVGEDEIDLDHNKISWKSPLAKCLLGKETDDEAVFVKPNGNEKIYILNIKYEA